MSNLSDESEYPIKCDYCDTRFKYDIERVKHDKNVHLKIECPSCDKLLRTDKQLQTHIEVVHHFKCELCDKSSGSLWEILSHDRIVHLTKECPYPYCYERYRSDAQLEKHIEGRHKSFQCEFCNKCHGSLWELEKHDTIVHLTMECPYCDKIYRLDEQLQKHIEYKHTFQCEMCDKSFVSQRDMNQHDRKVHWEGMYCPYCNNFYPTDEQLQKHIEYKHKFQCELCDKHFSSIEKLDKHDTNVHLIIECPSCDNLFFRKDDDLLNHIKSEHPDLCCKDCSKSFHSQELRDFHIRQMHEKSKEFE